MAETNKFTLKAYCYIDFNYENKKHILAEEIKDKKKKHLFHWVVF